MNLRVFLKVTSKRHVNDFSTICYADERKNKNKQKTPGCYSRGLGSMTFLYWIITFDLEKNTRNADTSH